jgi:hypothetical protein
MADHDSAVRPAQRQISGRISVARKRTLGNTYTVRPKPSTTRETAAAYSVGVVFTPEAVAALCRMPASAFDVVRLSLPARLSEAQQAGDKVIVSLNSQTDAFEVAILPNRRSRSSIERETPQRSDPAIDPTTHDLYNAKSGRLDAKNVSRAFGVTQRFIADVAEMNPATVSKTPDSEALQPTLRLFERIIRMLIDLVGKPEGARIWLHQASWQLGDRAPIDVIHEGHGDTVALLLENMMVGIPS